MSYPCSGVPGQLFDSSSPPAAGALDAHASPSDLNLPLQPSLTHVA